MMALSRRCQGVKCPCTGAGARERGAPSSEADTGRGRVGPSSEAEPARGGAGPRAGRSPLEGSASLRTGRSLLEGIFERVALVGR
jgi:hypothetical protein